MQHAPDASLCSCCPLRTSGGSSTAPPPPPKKNQTNSHPLPGLLPPVHLGWLDHMCCNPPSHPILTALWPQNSCFHPPTHPYNPSPAPRSCAVGLHPAPHRTSPPPTPTQPPPPKNHPHKHSTKLGHFPLATHLGWLVHKCAVDVHPAHHRHTIRQTLQLPTAPAPPGLLSPTHLGWLVHKCAVDVHPATGTPTPPRLLLLRPPHPPGCCPRHTLAGSSTSALLISTLLQAPQPLHDDYSFVPPTPRAAVPYTPWLARRQVRC
jgi:hypothetical protein